MPVQEGEAAEGRRRRTPGAARQEIVTAAESLLRERPFRDLTVDEVMQRTGLSRPSFYVYFSDRHELMLQVVDHLQAELLAVANRWYETIDGGPSVLREALEGVVSVYGEHSGVARALADAATDDRYVEAAYGALLQNFVDITAEHIEMETSAGHLVVTDPAETSKALVWMTERYLYHSFGPAKRVPAGRVTETLAMLWTRGLYSSP